MEEEAPSKSTQSSSVNKNRIEWMEWNKISDTVMYDGEQSRSPAGDA